MFERPIAPKLSLLLAFACAFGTGCGPAKRPRAAERAGHSEAHYPGPLPLGVTPHMYDVHLTLNPDLPTFSGHVAIAVELRDARREIFLHAEDLRLLKVWAKAADGTDRLADVTEDKTRGLICLRFAEALSPGILTLHLSYEGTWSSNLLGLYRVQAEQGNYVFSQFEAIAARRALPCFDEPRFKTPFQLRVTAPKHLSVLTGSVPIAEQIKAQQGVAEEVKTITFAPTPPLPTYLLAFAVGPFASTEGEIEANAWRSYPLPLKLYGTAREGGQLAQSKRFAAQLLGPLEAYTQLAYPFAKLDLLAVPDFAFSAMENAGLVTFRSDLLALGDHAPYQRSRAALSVMAHELTHQWFGNWVTMPWWDDLWLNESFATWLGARMGAALRPEMRFDLDLTAGMGDAMYLDRLPSTRRIRQPVHTRDDIFNAADATVYQKGAGLLNMLEHWLGHDSMAAGVRKHLAEHPFGTASSADFLATLAKAADEPAAAAVLQSFLEQPGVPEVEFALSCSDNRAALAVSQDRYRALGSDVPTAQWQLPLCVRYGIDSRSHRTCMLLKEGRAEWPLRGGCPNWLVVNAEGAGYYRSRANAAGTAAQIAAFEGGRLSPAESLAYLDNLQAGLASGAMPPSVVLPLLAHSLRGQEPVVIERSLGMLVGIYGRHLQQDALPAHARALATMLAPALTELEAEVGRRQLAAERSLQHGDAGDAARDRLGEVIRARRSLRAALASAGRERHLRANLSHAGVAWIERLEHGRQKPGSKEALQYAAQDPSLTAEEADLSLAMATSTLGLPFVARLLDALPIAELGRERATIVSALAHQDDPQVALQLRAHLFEPTFRIGERMQLLGAQLRAPLLAPAAWTFVKEQLPTLLGVISERDRQSLLSAAGSVGDRELGEALLQQLAAHLEQIPGGPRLLAQAGEEQRLLRAEQAAAKPGVEAFFSHGHKRAPGAALVAPASAAEL